MDNVLGERFHIFTIPAILLFEIVFLVLEVHAEGRSYLQKFFL